MCGETVGVDQLAGRQLLAVVYRNESVRVYQVNWVNIKESVSLSHFGGTLRLDVLR